MFISIQFRQHFGYTAHVCVYRKTTVHTLWWGLRQPIKGRVWKRYSFTALKAQQALYSQIRHSCCWPLSGCSKGRQNSTLLLKKHDKPFTPNVVIRDANPCKALYLWRWILPLLLNDRVHTCLPHKCVFRNKNDQHPEHSIIFRNTSGNISPHLYNNSSYQILWENHRAILHCAPPLPIPCSWEHCLPIMLDCPPVQSFNNSTENFRVHVSVTFLVRLQWQKATSHSILF